MHIRSLFALAGVLCLTLCCPQVGRTEDDLLSAVSLYASFDRQVRADFGGGALTPRTRFDHPTEAGRYVFQDEIDPGVFRVAEGKGIAGGALECVDVLPRRGRIFFPLKDNLAFDARGWDGALSMWLNTNPNTLLKTPYCDPVQITQKGAHDGGLWLDFPDSKPREMRLGVFPALAAGQKPLPDSDPRALLVHYPRVPFKSGQWHHVALCWSGFDSGRADAQARLYVDGRKIGEFAGREAAMKWDVDRAGIYLAVNYIGLVDELVLLDRALTQEEVALLFESPDWVNRRKNKLHR